MSITQNAFSRVEDIQYCPASNRLLRRMYEVPENCEPEVVNEKIRRVHTRPALIGRTTKMYKLEYLGVLLLRGEINACEGKPVTSDIIIRQLRREFPLWDRKAADNFVKDLSKYRNLYNQGKLHAQQSIPALYAFYYNEDGYICHKTIRKQMLTFPFCKQTLQIVGFADPRFFTIKEIADLRKRRANDSDSSIRDWIIPLQADIDAIERSIGKPLFNSITFADGYGINSRIL